MANKNIRNFCIIAHIDHGKSTLSDRILELTQSVDERTMSDQILDNMDIERERGITIKARAVTMHYTARDGQTYELNLIDTPGHVDFAYEVSRSLAACEGAILVVDATQGVEAQTLANTYMALEHDLELVPVLNKIDLPSAHPDEVAQEVEDVIGLPCMDAPRISAKTGLNIDFSHVEIEPLFEAMVDFETFSKSDFRAVKIKACSAVPKSKKLLQFVLDDGSGTDRVILSGIHAYYEPEELVGKTAIAITNLPPRKMMGIDSCGMLISAVHHELGAEKLHLLLVDDHIPAGAKLY